jgi:hypothetical protein
MVVGVLHNVTWTHISVDNDKDRSLNQKPRHSPTRSTHGQGKQYLEISHSNSSRCQTFEAFHDHLDYMCSGVNINHVRVSLHWQTATV